MSYQVLARKCRPQRFDELVGQTHVSTTLSNAIQTDKLAHAYIFAGLRGTGKTTVARILAKGLNCEKGTSPVPCGECASCTEIADSRSMDVLEVDAASRTKVEQTRELLEVVSFAPVRDRNKILIIDEAHMLSKASFNALLKTLEEPPPNVMFILATTELQKVLPTIVSRCQVFEFRRVGIRELSEYLKKICDAEGISVSKLAVERIARAGEGSVRDSLSVLERVMAFCGEQIDDDDVLRMLGGVRAAVLIEMFGAIRERNAAAMLSVLERLADEGQDLLHFWTEMISALRDLLLMRSMATTDDLLTRSPDEAAALEVAAEGLTVEDLSRIFNVFADLELPLKTSSQPRYLFEAAMIRIAGLGAVRPIEELLRALSQQGPGTEPAPIQKKKRERSDKVSPAAPAAKPKAVPSAGPDSGDLRSRIIAAVLNEKPMTGALLGQATSVRLEDSRLVFEFDGVTPAMVKPIQSTEILELIGRCASAVVGREVSIDLAVVAAPGRRRSSPAAVVSAAAPEPRAKQPAKKAKARDAGRGSLLEQARREPAVNQLLDDFGASVVEITPFEAGSPPAGGNRKKEPS